MAKFLFCLIVINGLALLAVYHLIYQFPIAVYPVNIFVYFSDQSRNYGLSINPEKSEPTREKFRLWADLHEKVYELDEFEQRYATFVANHYLVEELNRLYAGETEFSLNMFADMTPEEFKSKMLLKSMEKLSKHELNADKYFPELKAKELPESFDWREKGAVTPVKDQGSVGTCWAFSAVENLEGVYQIKGNHLTSLSVEQIVDCDGFFEKDSDHADCGVYGGWPYLAFEYVKAEGGIESEVEYSYCVGKKIPCLPCSPPGYNKTECGPPVPYCKLKESCQAKLDKSKFVPNLKVSGWKHTTQNENEIAAQLMNSGPLSVALNAELLQFYFRGVFDPLVCPKTLNHAVLMVGWGVRKTKIFGDKDYWLIKNSWGTKWGESGYFRIARGKGACGINLECVSAILE